jgi:Lipoxygenase
MGIKHLPLQDFGLKNIPAVPYKLDLFEPLGTVLRLGLRTVATIPAKHGLSATFTINGQTATGFEFLFGQDPPSNQLADAVDAIRDALIHDPEGLIRSIYDARIAGVPGPAMPADPAHLTALSLDDPREFSMSWTTFDNVARDAQPFLASWVATLEDPAAATAEFWPTIANFGVAYNLLILEKVGNARAAALQGLLGAAWTSELDTALAGGLLYVIDTSIFETLQPQLVHGFPRFTPATITLLVQHPVTKALRPVAIRVRNPDGAQAYVAGQASPSAWLYALQAAKVSVTVYGVWLGHVYHWHMVPAAMQMTMYNNLGPGDPSYDLLNPMSADLIGFDEVLLLLWGFIAPPTSIASSPQFLELTDRYARNRRFFDDDPKVTLATLGLDPAAFTSNPATPWDLYPAVQLLLQIWDITEAFVDAVVEHSYASDVAVAKDQRLQNWINQSAIPTQGNIQGLPTVNSRDALKSVLTSLVYRVTAHGISRINRAANPALSFTANFPPCLQNSVLPYPQANLDTKALLAFLPKTGTIGEMMSFYFIFVFSKPFTSLIPSGGVNTDLYFPGGDQDPRNQALIIFRNAIIGFLTAFDSAESVGQWPRTVDT